MEKIFDAIKGFVPVLHQYPKWIQILFFAVLLQILALTFFMVSYYVLVIKAPGKQVGNGQTPPDIKSVGANESNQKNVSEETKSKVEPTAVPTQANAPDGVTKDITKPHDNLHQELRITEKEYESDDPRIALALQNLASLYEAQGKFKEAETALRRALAIYERAYSRNHPSSATTLQSLSGFYLRTEKYSDAEKYQREALTIFEAIYGHDHPYVASALNSLAAIYLKLAKYKEAAPLIQRALEIRERGLGPDGPDMIPILENFVMVLEKTGDLEKAAAVSARLKALKEKYK
jgi:tetratricopeptide (TPR) repeat protein